MQRSSVQRCAFTDMSMSPFLSKHSTNIRGTGFERTPPQPPHYVDFFPHLDLHQVFAQHSPPLYTATPKDVTNVYSGKCSDNRSDVSCFWWQNEECVDIMFPIISLRLMKSS